MHIPVRGGHWGTVNTANMFTTEKNNKHPITAKRVKETLTLQFNYPMLNLIH